MPRRVLKTSLYIWVTLYNVIAVSLPAGTYSQKFLKARDVIFFFFLTPNEEWKATCIIMLSLTREWSGKKSMTDFKSSKQLKHNQLKYYTSFQADWKWLENFDRYTLLSASQCCCIVKKYIRFLKYTCLKKRGKIKTD